MKKHITADTVVAGKPLSEWIDQFVIVPGGFATPQDHLKGKVGLYIAVLDGQIMYIGRAVECGNNGLYKRLADFWREGDSGRKHYAGKMIHEHRGRLELRVLVTGDDGRAVGLAKLLRAALIALHKPIWNIRRPKGPELKIVRSTKPGSAANLVVPAKPALAA